VNRGVHSSWTARVAPSLSCAYVHERPATKPAAPICARVAVSFQLRAKDARSFVHDLGSNTEGQAIVRAILSLGSSLGITITAEGIETDAELACLQAAGCHEGQGFLFSKAQPQAEILEFLAKEAQQAA
jgi:predicted signal transduction protein with EAL and GGDEF domain